MDLEFHLVIDCVSPVRSGQSVDFQNPEGHMKINIAGENLASIDKQAVARSRRFG